MTTIKRGSKSVKLENGEYLYFWYANNKGRGSNNCTIIRTNCSERASRSKNQKNIIAKIQTSSWNGHINFSKYVQNKLGLN